MVPVAAAVAFPSLRLSGLFLALATFGFGMMVQDLLFPTSLAFGTDAVAGIPPAGALRSDPRPSTTSSSASRWPASSSWRSSAWAASGGSSGHWPTPPPPSSRWASTPPPAACIVFCLSAFLAAARRRAARIAVQIINPSSFEFFQSLLWVTVLVTAGARTFGGSVAGRRPADRHARRLSARQTITEWQPVAFGVDRHGHGPVARTGWSACSRCRTGATSPPPPGGETTVAGPGNAMPSVVLGRAAAAEQ